MTWMISILISIIEYHLVVCLWLRKEQENTSLAIIHKGMVIAANITPKVRNRHFRLRGVHWGRNAFSRCCKNSIHESYWRILVRSLNESFFGDIFWCPTEIRNSRNHRSFKKWLQNTRFGKRSCIQSLLLSMGYTLHMPSWNVDYTWLFNLCYRCSLLWETSCSGVHNSGRRYWILCVCFQFTVFLARHPLRLM